MNHTTENPATKTSPQLVNLNPLPWRSGPAPAASTLSGTTPCPMSLRDHLGNDEEQVGVAGRLSGGGDQRVRLAAVMRLVVEEMRDQ